MAPAIYAIITKFKLVTKCIIVSYLKDHTMKAMARARVVVHWIDLPRVNSGALSGVLGTLCALVFSQSPGPATACITALHLLTSQTGSSLRLSVGPSLGARCALRDSLGASHPRGEMPAEGAKAGTGDTQTTPHFSFFLPLQEDVIFKNFSFYDMLSALKAS